MPTTAETAHEVLGSILTPEAITSLTKSELAGKRLELPKADKALQQLRNIAIAEARKIHTAPQVAQMFDLSRRRIIMIQKDINRDDDQGARQTDVPHDPARAKKQDDTEDRQNGRSEDTEKSPEFRVFRGTVAGFPAAPIEDGKGHPIFVPRAKAWINTLQGTRRARGGSGPQSRALDTILSPLHSRGSIGYHAGMCGRFTLTVSARVLADLFGVEDLPDVRPRYNIAPTQSVLMVRGTSEAQPEFGEARWGLIPGWAKDAKIGARMINARAETVADKPAFRSALRRRRCLIPSDGFYEWRKLAGGKQPYLIRFTDGSPFAFAGLWERWHDSDGQAIDSCTIITTTPNDLVAHLHDRMPVILPSRHHSEWLGSDTFAPERLAELLQPCPASGMEAYPVSKRVNNPANDDSRCIARIDEPDTS